MLMMTNWHARNGQSVKKSDQDLVNEMNLKVY